MAKALTYCTTELNMAVKSFMLQNAGDYTIKEFAAVINSLLQ
jgi:hypothetical protein